MGYGEEAGRPKRFIIMYYLLSHLSIFKHGFLSVIIFVIFS